ncbi:DUF3822 family protein [Croceimicrobium sp.]|uniref:DUF3822 family protein n=1 Tax=Croceimicrobium sp. TaxID=2828340 RepID=UPI003BAB705A
MVTGDNIAELSLKVDQGLNRDTLKDCHTVLSLSKTGFSIMVAGENKSRILLSAQRFWKEEKSESKLIDLFEKTLDQLPVNPDLSASIKCLVNFQKFSLVPEHFYQKGKGQQILSYTAKLQKGDRIYTDHWTHSEALMLHAIPERISEWLSKRFMQAQIQHQATSIENLYQTSKSEDFTGILYVSPSEADFYLAQKGKVQWYNKFQYQTEEDLLYFILYSLEQNRFLPTELHLKVAGLSLKGDKLHSLLERYIGEVKDMSVPSNYQLSPMISEKDLRENINLLGLL